MRAAPLLPFLAVLASCGMGGSSGGSAAPANAWVLVSDADLVSPHGYWQLRSIIASPAEDGTAVRIGLHEGEVVAITAHPDVGYHVVWSGTNDDASTSNTNSFTAHDGATVLVDFVP